MLRVRQLRIGPISILLLVLAGAGCSRPSAPETVTLTYLDVEWDTPDALPELAQALQDFTHETGIQVRRLPRPDGSLNQLVEWRELLQNGALGPDVVSIDVIWSGILSQYLLDLKPQFASELASQDAAVLDSYSVDGKVVAIPHHAYVGVLLYRPDLLRKYGYREPPKTWDQLESMAGRIQAGERNSGNRNFWGYLWQGGMDEDLTCDGLEWQASEGAGRIIEPDKTISVNNPQTIQVWRRAAKWIGSISPPSVTAYAKWDAHNAWGSGNAAFLRSWQGDYSIAARGWPLSGSPPVHIHEIGTTSVPGGRERRAATLGGNGLAINRSSNHQQEALQLVRFLVHRDARQDVDAERIGLPNGFELFELPSALRAFSRFDKSKNRGATLVTRPSIESGSKYEDVTRAYIRAVHSVIAREKDASIAASDLESELIKITGFHARRLAP